jgi:hypothetical protein
MKTVMDKKVFDKVKLNLAKCKNGARQSKSIRSQQFNAIDGGLAFTYNS